MCRYSEVPKQREENGNSVITKQHQLLFLPFHDQIKAQEQLCGSLSSPPSLLTCFISMTLVSLFPFYSTSERSPCSLQECSPCPWGLCKGCTMHAAAGHPVVETFPGCHPQLWPVTPLNTTHVHTPQLLWLRGQNLVVSTLKSPPTPLNSNLQYQGQQQEPKPRK